MLSLIKKIENSSSLSKEFWERLGSEFHVHSIPTSDKFAYKIFNKICSSYDEIKYHLVKEFENLISQRKVLLEKTKLFFKDKNGITTSMVNQAADCHLRKHLNKRDSTANSMLKCDLCICDQIFREYSDCLYSNSDEAVKLASRRGKTTDESDDDQEFNEQLNQHYQGQIKTSSDFENFNKSISLFIRNMVSNY